MTKEEIIDNIARLNSETWRDREEVRTEIGKLLTKLEKVLEQDVTDTNDGKIDSDCVSRQAILEFVESKYQSNWWNVDEVLAKIKALPPVTPTQRWIPVSERLPEKVGTYLVTLEYKEHGKGITTLWYHGEQFGWDLRVADIVLAWQPLPQPYEEKRGNEDGSN